MKVEIWRFPTQNTINAGGDELHSGWGVDAFCKGFPYWCQAVNGSDNMSKFSHIDFVVARYMNFADGDVSTLSKSKHLAYKLDNEIDVFPRWRL